MYLYFHLRNIDVHPASPFSYFYWRNFLKLSRSKFLIDDKRRSRGSRLDTEHGRLAMKSQLTGLRVGLRNGGGAGGIGTKELPLFICLDSDESVFWRLLR